MTLNELSDITGRDIILKRYSKQGTRWTARLEGAENIQPGNKGSLVGLYGDGRSMQDAIADYVKKIRGTTLVFGAMGKGQRTEFGVPSTLEVNNEGR